MISDNTVKTNATKDKLEEDMTKLSTEGHCRMLGGCTSTPAMYRGHSLTSRDILL